MRNDLRNSITPLAPIKEGRSFLLLSLATMIASFLPVAASGQTPLPGLAQIRVYERTSGANTQIFQVPDVSGRLAAQIQAPFTASDFIGAPGELYDVYFSDANGDLSPTGPCVTVAGQYGRAGGFNIAGIDIQFVNSTQWQWLTQIGGVTLGTNAVPTSIVYAIDGQITTSTTLGTTPPPPAPPAPPGAPATAVMRLTLCSAASKQTCCCCTPSRPVWTDTNHFYVVNKHGQVVRAFWNQPWTRQVLAPTFLQVPLVRDSIVSRSAQHIAGVDEQGRLVISIGSGNSLQLAFVDGATRMDPCSLVATSTGIYGIDLVGRLVRAFQTGPSWTVQIIPTWGGTLVPGTMVEMDNGRVAGLLSTGQLWNTYIDGTTGAVVFGILEGSGSDFSSY